jgi:hypothetical protein
MSTPRALSPADDEISNYMLPTLEWEAVLRSTVAGDVADYGVQVDNNDDFRSPEVDTRMDNHTSFTLTSELSVGGMYYWRLQAFYEKDQTAGWGPAHRFFLNTPPMWGGGVPLLRFPEDTTARHLLDLDKAFRDDLFDGRLNYSVAKESDPMHVLASIDGHWMDFTSPVKDWNGEARFTVRATDPLGLWSNSPDFTVRVTPVNDAPVVAPVPDITVVAGEELVYDLAPYISDVDTLPAGLSLRTDSPSAVPDGLAFRLNFTSTGPASVEFWVYDGELSAPGAFNVSVLRSAWPPRIAPIPPVVMNEDQAFRMELWPFVSDDNTPPDLIKWGVVAVSAGSPPIFEAAIVNGSTLEIVPAANASGEGGLVLAAVDADGRSDSRAVNVTVAPVNDRPVISPVADVSLLAGANATVELIIYDPDTPRGMLRLESLSPLAAVNGLSLVVSIPADFKLNRTTVHIRVSDGDLSTDENFTVLVRFRPVISAALPGVTTKMGVNARLDLASFVTDQNDPPSPLTWTISGQYTGHFNAYIDRDGSTLRITPLRAGQENLTLTVRNRYNGTDSRTITVTVEGKRAPAPDPLRWPATVAVVAAAAAVLFLAGRAWRRAESAPGPQKRTGGQAPPKTGGKGR